MKLNYFNFKKFRDKYLLTNDFGKYVFLSETEFKAVISGEFNSDESLCQKLVEAKMVYADSDLNFTSQNRYVLRESKDHLNTATGLHIFVVDTACNLNCIYCQANNGNERPHQFMSIETARKAVDFALQSPSKYLNFEFQGGEPLLNIDVIKEIIRYAEENKGKHCIEYNVVSNLTLLTDDLIDYFKENGVGISTSLDGSELVHDSNRPFPDGSGSFDKVVASIGRLREKGIKGFGAIETTTRFSLDYPEQIVDEYVGLGFESIFLRPLTPLGKATKNWSQIGYKAEEFLDFYKKAFYRLIEINKSGRYMKENHASIFIKRLLGENVNYMELRSPCGASIGQMAYFPDGNIFTCDEGRMLYEMGNEAFKLGDVNANTFEEVIKGPITKTMCVSSMLETIPSCCDCVYQPYCGTCPVVTYANHDDIMEKTPRGYRCQIYSGILDIIFGVLQKEDEETINIIKSWGN